MKLYQNNWHKKNTGTSTVEFVVVVLGIIVILTVMMPKVLSFFLEHNDEYINGMAAPTVSIDFVNDAANAKFIKSILKK